MYGLQRSSSDSVARHVSTVVKSSSLSGIPNVTKNVKSNSPKTFKTNLLKFTVSPIRLGTSKSSDTFFVRDPSGRIAKLVPVISNTVDGKSIACDTYDPYDNKIIKDVLSGINKEFTIIWLDDV